MLGRTRGDQVPTLFALTKPDLTQQFRMILSEVACMVDIVIFERGKMLKITRAANREVIFTVSGRMDSENLAELKALLESEIDGHRITLDLKDLTLVDQDAVGFLEYCEAGNIQLKNCPAYIREWITRERDQRSRQRGIDEDS